MTVEKLEVCDRCKGRKKVYVDFCTVESKDCKGFEGRLESL